MTFFTILTCNVSAIVRFAIASAAFACLGEAEVSIFFAIIFILLAINLAFMASSSNSSLTSLHPDFSIATHMAWVSWYFSLETLMEGELVRSAMRENTLDIAKDLTGKGSTVLILIAAATAGSRGANGAAVFDCDEQSE